MSENINSIRNTLFASLVLIHLSEISPGPPSSESFLSTVSSVDILSFPDFPLQIAYVMPADNSESQTPRIGRNLKSHLALSFIP